MAALLRKETAPTEPAEHAVVEKNARAVTDSFNSCAFSPLAGGGREGEGVRRVAIHLDVHKRERVCISVSEYNAWHRDKIQSTLHDVASSRRMYSYLGFILAS